MHLHLQDKVFIPSPSPELWDQKMHGRVESYPPCCWRKRVSARPTVCAPPPPRSQRRVEHNEITAKLLQTIPFLTQFKHGADVKSCFSSRGTEWVSCQCLCSTFMRGSLISCAPLRRNSSTCRTSSRTDRLLKKGRRKSSVWKVPHPAWLVPRWVSPLGRINIHARRATRFCCSDVGLLTWGAAASALRWKELCCLAVIPQFMN